MALQRGAFTCPLCIEKKFSNVRKMKNHFQALHINHSVRLGNKLSLLCKLICSKFNRGHFHCPYCEQLFYHTKRLFLHYHRHYINKQLPYSMQLQKKTAGSERTICIDCKEGLFLVLRSFLYYTDEPLHVIRNDHEQKCSDALCAQAMEEAQVNGCPMICKHLARVDAEHLNMAPDFTFEDCQLDEFEIPASERESCITIRSASMSKKVSSVVAWASNNVWYFSVHCLAPFATFTRTIVKYDVLAGEYECKCPIEQDHVCPYKILAMLYTKVLKLSESPH